MRKSWRSWFWNVVLTVGMLVMSLTTTSVLFATKNVFVSSGFGALSFIMWAGAGRTPTLGVFAKPKGLVVRKFMRTITIPWNEIEEIRDGGIAGMAGVGCPVVVRRRPDGKRVEIELDVLGSYGIISGRRRSSNAVVEMNEYKMNWRRENR